MGLINEYLKKIKEAIYGEEVRGSIHDAIEQCYKDATGHPDSVAATVKEIGEVSKRIDNLIATGTAQSQEVGKTIATTSQGSKTKINFSDSNVIYTSAFDTVKISDSLFARIDEDDGSPLQILKEGLYYLNASVEIKSEESTIPATAYMILLEMTDEQYNKIGSPIRRVIDFPSNPTFSIERQQISYLFKAEKKTNLRFIVSSIADTSDKLAFSIDDIMLTALDWKGKQSADLSELHDLRIGADGVVHNTAGEAVRKQIGNLTEDLGNTKSQLDESIADIGNGFTTGFFTPATVKISDTRSSINPENGEISTGYRPMTNIIKALLHRNIKIHTAEENYYHIVFEYDEKMHFVRSLGWNKSSIAEYDLKSGNNYIVSFDSPKLPNNNNSPSVEDARRIYTVTMNSNTKVAELDSKIKDTTPKNLIGNELNKTYSVNIPKGTLFTISTSDGSTIERENFKVNVIYSDGTEDYWTIKIGTSERTISDTKDIVGLYLTETLNVPIQVEIGNKTEYEEHFDNVKDINKRVDAIETKNDGFLLPSYLSGEYENTINTIESNKAEDTVLFGIMTDLHIPSINSGYNLYLRNGVIYSMKALSNMTKDMRFDFVSFLGDYEQFPTKANGQTKQMGFDVLLEINDYIAKMNTKALAIQGNHEANYTGGGDSYGMSDEEFFKYCTEQSVYRNGIITDGTHCYYDDDKNRLRYVFINSASENVDPTVTSFLQRMADTKYDVIVLSHFGGDSGVLYDSTKLYIDTLRTNGANVILWLSGHSHQDWHYVYNKCLIISFLQSGFWTSSPSENGINYEHETGNSNYCAFTAVLLNRKDKKVHCIRFGLGIDYTYDII